MTESRKGASGECEHCGHHFEYRLIHNGFNDSAYAYCDSCGQTALLGGYQMPESLKIAIHQSITADDERKLKLCPCGGRFKHDASPRCPHCMTPLSASAAARWIEASAPGAAKGWRWQRSWKGLYCILIEDRRVENNWLVD